MAAIQPGVRLDKDSVLLFHLILFAIRHRNRRFFLADNTSWNRGIVEIISNNCIIQYLIFYLFYYFLLLFLLHLSSIWPLITGLYYIMQVFRPCDRIQCFFYVCKKKK